MTFWLLFSIAFVLLDIQTGAEFWAISFIPAAYFFGVFLKKYFVYGRFFGYSAL